MRLLSELDCIFGIAFFECGFGLRHQAINSGTRRIFRRRGYVVGGRVRPIIIHLERTRLSSNNRSSRCGLQAAFGSTEIVGGLTLLDDCQPGIIRTNDFQMLQRILIPSTQKGILSAFEVFAWLHLCVESLAVFSTFQRVTRLLKVCQSHRHDDQAGTANQSDDSTQGRFLLQSRSRRYNRPLVIPFSSSLASQLQISCFLNGLTKFRADSPT